MATPRLAMFQVREILRMKWVEKRTHREVARALGISAGTVGSVMGRATRQNLTWSESEGLDDEALEQRLMGPRAPSRSRPKPNPVWIHTELCRKGVTLELLHMEYLEKYPETGYQYTSFCGYYRRWLKKQSPTMRQVHRAGEKVFVDYSGAKASIVDRTTGERQEMELFVGALGASHYIYAEASHTQQVPDWVSSHVRMFAFFGGVPRAIVPDQLKSGVRSADRYEPLAQRSYAEMARHYQTSIVPARPAKPQDKAKAEVAVQLAQRWILARLRNETFFSLSALNERIRQLTHELNARPMKKRGGVSRQELFEQLEKTALKPLPESRYEFGRWKTARVHIDYHVEYERHFYSVPSRFVRDKVEIRATATTVEVFHQGKRIASHPRSSVSGQATTVAAHMPKSHRAHAEWTPSRMIQWAETIGPRTKAMVTTLFETRSHPELAYRSCLGLLRLAKLYEHERLERACARSLRLGGRSYRSVASMLKHGLDRLDEEEEESSSLIPTEHAHVRGASYFH